MINTDIKRQNTVLKTEIQRWQNLDTGEIIEAAEMVKKIGRQGFMITYLSAIINFIEILGNKKMQVVKYILANMDKSTNTIIITTRELAIKSGVGLNTVIETLKILDNANVIKRRVGSLMINSNLVHRGNANKEQSLVMRFQEFEILENEGDEEGYIDIIQEE